MRDLRDNGMHRGIHGYSIRSGRLRWRRPVPPFEKGGLGGIGSTYTFLRSQGKSKSPRARLADAAPSRRGRQQRPELGRGGSLGLAVEESKSVADSKGGARETERGRET
ncbi:hypothetical protein LA76x_4868 [Lysobacter antibioticus]|uniref:Uncharacterized protein n=1 Tax=Lysobacter antibioticus TaxID=84531 RepID=A0A0S2FHC8_LYSAN|nr:hypothetical protein LA76x_4868 [Lysobacter antibioticus]